MCPETSPISLEEQVLHGQQLCGGTCSYACGVLTFLLHSKITTASPFTDFPLPHQFSGVKGGVPSRTTPASYSGSQKLSHHLGLCPRRTTLRVPVRGELPLQQGHSGCDRTRRSQPGPFRAAASPLHAGQLPHALGLWQVEACGVPRHRHRLLDYRRAGMTPLGPNAAIRLWIVSNAKHDPSFFCMWACCPLLKRPYATTVS